MQQCGLWVEDVMEADEVWPLGQQQMGLWFCGWKLPKDAVLTNSGRLQSDGGEFAECWDGEENKQQVLRRQPRLGDTGRELRWSRLQTFGQREGGKGRGC